MYCSCKIDFNNSKIQAEFYLNAATQMCPQHHCFYRKFCSIYRLICCICCNFMNCSRKTRKKIKDKYFIYDINNRQNTKINYKILKVFNSHRLNFIIQMVFLRTKSAITEKSNLQFLRKALV